MGKEIVVDGIVYVPKKEVLNASGLKMVMVRTLSAGVHFGYLAKRESTLAGIEVTLLNARRVWYWAGAATLSQLTMEGTTKPNECKLPCEVSSIELIAIEIIPMTNEAFVSLKNIPVWRE